MGLDREWLILDAWLIVLDLVIGGATYLLYHTNRRVLRNLEKTSVLDVNPKLELFLQSFPNKRIEWIGIRGRISSLEIKTDAKNIPSFNVIKLWKYVQKSLKYVLTSSPESKPILITHSMTLLSPRNDSGPLPFMVSVDNISWRENGVVVSGLPEGTSQGFPKDMIVTLYGKLQWVAPGDIRVQYTGDWEQPYIFTKYSHSELIQVQNGKVTKWGSAVRWYAYLGAFILGGILYCEWRRYKRHAKRNELNKQILPMLEKVVSKNLNICRSEETHTICVFCKEAKRDTHFLGCAHVSMCYLCTKAVYGRCPACSVVSNYFTYPVYIC